MNVDNMEHENMSNPPSFFLRCGIVIVVVVGICVALVYGPFLKASLSSRSLRESTFETVVRPGAQWVKDFRTQNGRHPTNDELARFAGTNNLRYRLWLYDSPLQWDEVAYHSWREGDFVLSASTEEWNLYYNSWDQKEWSFWRYSPWD
jgi:hypothetical protein